MISLFFYFLIVHKLWILPESASFDRNFISAEFKFLKNGGGGNLPHFLGPLSIWTKSELQFWEFSNSNLEKKIANFSPTSSSWIWMRQSILGGYTSGKAGDRMIPFGSVWIRLQISDRYFIRYSTVFPGDIESTVTRYFINIISGTQILLTSLAPSSHEVWGYSWVIDYDS